MPYAYEEKKKSKIAFFSNLFSPFFVFRIKLLTKDPLTWGKHFRVFVILIFLLKEFLVPPDEIGPVFQVKSFALVKILSS